MHPELADHLRGMDPVRVIYSDLDGTMLGAAGSVLLDADGTPFLGAAAALIDAAEAGVEVVPVTGRRGEQLREDMKLLGLAHGIGEAGCVRVHRTGPIQLRWGSTPRGIASTPRESIQKSGALDVVMDLAAGALRQYQPWDAGRQGGYLLHGQVDVATARLALDSARLEWVKLVDNGATGGWPERDVVHAYHLIPQGVGKAAAVRDDLSERGVPASAAVAIGDSPEDETMSEVVGTYIAVGNASTAAGGNRFRVDGHASRGFAEAIAAVLDPVAAGRIG